MNVAISSLLTVLVCSQAPPARHQTANFVVDAETPAIAQMVAEAAESHRSALGKAWFGKSLPDWSTPCQIKVVITMQGPHALTELSYERKKVVAHRIELHGLVEELLKGPLPHEVMHVLWGHHFGQQTPRWADEGAAILAEDAKHVARQQQVFLEILADNRQLPLRQLLAMCEYPVDLRCLYAQGHAVSQFLLAAKGRDAFLAFVADGLERDWDMAVRKHYGYRDVDHLERAWLDAMARDQKASAIPPPKSAR